VICRQRFESAVRSGSPSSWARGLVLIRRSNALRLPRERWWYALAAAIDVGALGAGLATAVAGTIGLFEWQLLFLLARPMLAFVLVLASLRHD